MKIEDENESPSDVDEPKNVVPIKTTKPKTTSKPKVAKSTKDENIVNEIEEPSKVTKKKK